MHNWLRLLCFGLLLLSSCAGVADDVAFNSVIFHANVDRAIQAVTKILATTRNPQLPENVDHVYEDKYLLAEFLSNVALAATLNALETLGLTNDVLAELLYKLRRTPNEPVTLQFTMEQNCAYEGEQKKQVVDSDTNIEENVKRDDGKSSWLFDSSTFSSVRRQQKVSHYITEYHWKLSYSYKVQIVVGSAESSLSGIDDHSIIDILEGNPSIQVVTGFKGFPSPHHNQWDPETLSLAPLLTHIAPGTYQSRFQIDRSNEGCKTPRRNRDINSLMEFAIALKEWTLKVCQHINFMAMDDSRLNMGKEGFTTVRQHLDHMIQGYGVALLEPIVPLMMENGTLEVQYLEMLLNEHTHRLDLMVDKIAQKDSEKSDNVLLSAKEILLYTVSDHMGRLTQQYMQGVSYIEHLLAAKLIEAIGKEVTSRDFDEFMRFHSKRLLALPYQMKPFSHSIRQPGYFPVGSLSIEDSHGQVVDTMVRSVGENRSAFVSINSATSIEIRGNTFVHGWMMHRFANETEQQKFHIAARAHQFSSFLLVLGKVEGPNAFAPEYAMVLQNRDEIMIPILSDVLLGAAAFKEAISSLSPDQQDFAMAFRDMQLRSSVFGVCVIQLKPQLERVLNLPAGALKKEIQLTHSLMTLFMEYQIPPDLLSYDGPEDELLEAKLSAVRGHTDSLLQVINELKQKQTIEIYPFSPGIPYPSPAAAPALYSVRKRTSELPSGDDFSALALLLDGRLERYDQNGALRLTVIQIDANGWSLRKQKSIVDSFATYPVPDTKQRRQQALDLMDVITRSGNLPILAADLHVIVAMTHCFEQSVIATVIQENVNPITAVEKSLLLLGSTIHGRPASDLLEEGSRIRMNQTFPALFAGEEVARQDTTSITPSQ